MERLVPRSLTSRLVVTAVALVAVVSLLIWALILIVTIKYVLILMRADNKGEGGILTLVVLAEQALRRRRSFVLILGVVGAAFFFGDAFQNAFNEQARLPLDREENHADAVFARLGETKP